MGCENDKERRKEIYPDNSDLNKSSRLYVKSVTISWKKNEISKLFTLLLDLTNWIYCNFDIWRITIR